MGLMRGENKEQSGVWTSHDGRKEWGNCQFIEAWERCLHVFHLKINNYKWNKAAHTNITRKSSRAPKLSAVTSAYRPHHQKLGQKAKTYTQRRFSVSTIAISTSRGAQWCVLERYTCTCFSRFYTNFFSILHFRFMYKLLFDHLESKHTFSRHCPSSELKSRTFVRHQK